MYSHTGGLIIVTCILSSPNYHWNSLFTQNKIKGRERKPHLLWGLHLRSHAGVVSCYCRTGITVWRLGSGSALARATWKPSTEDHPLHVLLLCLSFFAAGSNTKLVTTLPHKVLSPVPPSPCPWRMPIHRRNYFWARCVQEMLRRQQQSATTTAASAPRIEPRGSERARLQEPSRRSQNIAPNVL